MKKKILYILSSMIILFIIVNSIVFIGIIQNTVGMPFASARVYMLSAKKINELYIYPLTDLTGWESPATKPFYIIRDKLYHTGLSRFPKNEGEREIWWYKIKQDEFRTIVYDRVVEYCQNRYPAPYLYGKKDEFIKWNNEIYSHIEPLAMAKITDKTFSKQKLSVWVDLAMLSQETNENLSSKLNAQKQGKLEPNADKSGIYPTIDQVQKYDNVYNQYLYLLDYSKKYDKDSYAYFIKNNKMWGAELIHNIALTNLQAKFNSYQLNCNDKYLKIYADTHREIRDYYFANENNITPYGLKFRLGMDALTTYPMIAYKCRNNPYLKDYIKYIVTKATTQDARYLDSVTLNKIKSLNENEYNKKFEIWMDSSLKNDKKTDRVKKDKKLMGIK